MPVVIVEMYEGRTLDQKRALVHAITNAMVEHAAADPDGLHVIIHDVPKQNWARAGRLGVDRPEARPGAEKIMAESKGISHLLLQTADLERAERFYTGLLGFHVRERGVFGDGQKLVVMREGLGLTERPGMERQSQQHQSLEHVAFHVADIAALERDLRAAGVTIIDGSKRTHYGISLYFFDPDGVRIECCDYSAA